MNNSTSQIMHGALLVDRLSINKKLIAAAIGIVLLTASSYAEIPMYPVPMTMQTAAVLLIGALYGRTLGSITVASWLGLAALGAPLLSGGSGGITKFSGPTAGYLLGFLVAAYFVGWLSDRGWNGMKPFFSLVSMWLGSKIILGLGWAWLTVLFGSQKAWEVGVAPFIVGDIVKTFIAVAVLVCVHKVFTEKLLK